MTTMRRMALVLLGALAFGMLAALIEGPGGGSGAEIRNAIGNLSTPWILVGFVAGMAVRRPHWGALAGLSATMIALGGYYLVSSPMHDLGQGFVGDLRLELSANRGYLQGGVITGLAFGVLGAWWRQRRTLRASFLAGALLLAEPVVLIVLGALGPGGALDPDGVTPTLGRIVPGWGLSGDSSAVAIAVYATEFALGLGVLLAALRPRRRLIN